MSMYLTVLASLNLARFAMLDGAFVHRAIVSNPRLGSTNWTTRFVARVPIAPHALHHRWIGVAGVDATALGPNLPVGAG